MKSVGNMETNIVTISMDKKDSSGGFLQGYFDYNLENLKNMRKTTISIAKRLEYTKY